MMTDSSKEDDMTTSAKVRHEYLATGVSAISVLTFLALVVGASLGVVSLAAISQPWFLLFSAIVATSVVYALGRDRLVRFWER